MSSFIGYASKKNDKVSVTGVIVEEPFMISELPENMKEVKEFVKGGNRKKISDAGLPKDAPKDETWKKNRSKRYRSDKLTKFVYVASDLSSVFVYDNKKVTDKKQWLSYDIDKTGFMKIAKPHKEVGISDNPFEN